MEAIDQRATVTENMDGAAGSMYKLRDWRKALEERLAVLEHSEVKSCWFFYRECQKELDRIAQILPPKGR
jgi:hypothetical protein